MRYIICALILFAAIVPIANTAASAGGWDDWVRAEDHG